MTITADAERMVPTRGGVQVRVLSFASRTQPAAGRILFVPGFLSFIESWELVLAELMHRFDVHYFESREKRSSIVPAHARYRITELVADLDAVVVALALAPGSFDIVAACGGAATVLQAHADLGLRPRRMVWVGPSLKPRLPWILVPASLVLRGPFYGLLQRLAVGWYRRFLNPPGKDAFQHSRFMDVVARADPIKATRGARDIYGHAVDPAVARSVRAPVLILAASRDVSHPYADIVRLAGFVPDVQTRGCGRVLAHARAGRRACHGVVSGCDPSVTCARFGSSGVVSGAA